MPFGAVAAVYAWDRVGSALTEILRQGMLLPVDRYVDDLFWPDWATISSDTRALVLLLMDHIGFRLDPEKTATPADSMDLLGINQSIYPSGQCMFRGTDQDRPSKGKFLDGPN